MHVGIMRAIAALALVVFHAGAVTAAPLRIVTQSIPETRGDPHSYVGLPAALPTQAIFEPLVAMGAGGKVLPGLAESWIQEAPQRWVFRLRSGVRFSNGEPLTAAAVVAVFDYMLGTPLPADSLPAARIRNAVAGATARDALTVVVETKAVDPILPLHLFSLNIPAPGAWAKGMERFAGAPVGSGPYRVVTWSPASVMLASNATSRTPGKVAEIEIRAIPDQTARGLALMSGSTDIAMDIAPDVALPDARFRLAPRTSTMVTFIQFVTVGDSPLKDVRIRRALNHAVDREKLIKAFLNGAVKPATQFTHENAFGFNAALAPYAYDPAKAKALLADAGFAKGLAIPVVFVGCAGPDVPVYQQLAADLAAVGVTMDFRAITLPTWMGYLNSGDWPARAFVTGVQGYDPLDAFTTRSCSWAKPHYCDPAVLPMLKAARDADTADVRRQRVAAIMAHEHDDPPGIMLWPRAAFDGLGPRIKTYVAGQDRVNFADLMATP